MSVNTDDVTSIIEAIDEGYASTPRSEKTRRYIGASGIGNKCDAALAFALRGFPDDQPSPRLQRIFALGHIIEEIVVKDLRGRAAIPIMEVDPLTGRQFRYTQLGEHIRCNLDGLIELPDGRLRNLEIKSMNDASFTKFKEKGVRQSHPHYFDQCQMQMAMSKTRSTLFIAYNKNTSEYCAQIIGFDEMDWEFLKSRIETALSNQAHRISADESDWRCRGCFKFSVCWKGKEAERACSSCQHAAAVQDGWFCTRHGKEATAPCAEFQQYAPLPKE